MKDPDNIDWEREGCLGCKQRGSCGMTYRLDNGAPAPDWHNEPHDPAERRRRIGDVVVDELTHEDVEHARAEIHLEHHFWHAPSVKTFDWEHRLADDHPWLYLGAHVLYALIILALILTIAVIA